MAKRVKTNYDRGYVNAMDKIRVFIESSSKVMYVDTREYTMIEEKAQQKSMEQLTGKYRTESDTEDIVTHDPIEIIQPDEFGDIDDYETRGLTYYADGKLVFDEETMPVNDDDIPNIIGTEALNHFGEFMPSTIHVRNNNYHKDYEIIQVRQNWGDLYPEEEEE